MPALFNFMAFLACEEALFVFPLPPPFTRGSSSSLMVHGMQINFASSIYVLYMAFLVIVTPPFIVYG